MARADRGEKVVGVGLAVLDHLLLWRDTSEPVAGNRVVEVDMQGGGMVGTALVAVARLGGAGEFWGTVGCDWVGEQILAGLRREGVDVRRVRRVEGRPSPRVIVCVDAPTGERHFLHFTGVLEHPGPLAPAKALAGAGCLLVDHTQKQAELAAAGEARRLGVPVVGDLSRIDEASEGILSLLDCAIVSESCGGALADGGDLRTACERIRSMGPARVVITLGARGLVYLDGERFGEMPAFTVDVVDTTGAGDVFHGAFCLALTEGMAFEERLRFASATAAIKCTRLGGRAGIPGREDVLAFLRERSRPA